MTMVPCSRVTAVSKGGTAGVPGSVECDIGTDTGGEVEDGIADVACRSFDTDEAGLLGDGSAIEVRFHHHDRISAGRLRNQAGQDADRSGSEDHDGVARLDLRSAHGADRHGKWFDQDR